MRIQMSLSTLSVSIYDLTSVQAGLMYMSFSNRGFWQLTGGGERDYHVFDELRVEDLLTFSIEPVRLKIVS